MRDGDIICALEVGWHRRRKWWVYYALVWPKSMRLENVVYWGA